MKIQLKRLLKIILKIVRKKKKLIQIRLKSLLKIILKIVKI